MANELMKRPESEVMTGHCDAECMELMPMVDIMENPEEFIMYFEVPGAKASTVNIEVENGILSMTAGSTLCRNGHPVMFKRRFQLSSGVACDKITAKTADGVLTLTVPKSDHAKVHKIKVS